MKLCLRYNLLSEVNSFNMKKFLIGIDEVGRGPLAGPVTVGVVCVPIDFDWKPLPTVADSKALSAKKREIIFEQATTFRRSGLLDYEVTSVSARDIDTIGIAAAIRKATKLSLAALRRRSKFKPSEVFVKLDGGLKAPAEYLIQETIIKGDGKELVIGLASVLAKVTRDRYMQRLKDGLYGFAIHKGYGTKRHRQAIVDHGLSSEHRTTFCRNVLTERALSKQAVAPKAQGT